MIDLIHELKELLSKLETSEILGYIATKFITFASDEKEVSKNSNIFNKTSLDSPYKQYMYLAGLLMSTDYIAEDDIDSDSRILDKREEIYLKIEEKLKKITSSYIQFFIPGDITKEELQKLNEFEKQKRLVSMQVFLAYHNTDILRYEEQIISRLKLLAMPFNQKLIDNIGLSVSDFIAFYNFILNKYSESINAVVRRVREFYDDYEKMIIKVEKMSNAEEAHKYMLKRAQKIDPTLFEKIDNLCMICVDSIKYKFGVEKTNKFLDLFSLNRKKRDFTYYNSPNPFEQKPLCWIDDKRLFVVHPKIVLSAIYNGVQEILEEMHKQNKNKGR